jgi:predicted ATP-dependent endonuclease of OLD family
VDHEAESNPTNRVGEKLLPRVPEFLLFDDDNRNLAAGYVWAEHAVAPDALANLCDAADVDYDEFRAIATDPTRKDELATLELAASEQLKKVFASWTQAGMRVAFKADTEMLLLHVYDDAGKRAIPFDQRSAGLRSFVALIAFVIRYAGAVKPVLLIDEAETHLHYGGQADLVQVFERQEVAQTIIYTTHSVGCLPEDLGTTIRCVAQVGDERSEVRNGFWSMDVTGAGLTPLMLAMGATAFAFTPSRFAVIGEGPTEAILLPSLFREARAARHEGRPLGFQVAPGIARVSAEAAAGLELDAGNLAYLVDADEGGRANGEKLPERVKNEKRLFILGDDKEEGLCTEDLLDVEVYVDAVNRALRLSDNDKKLTPADLPDLARPAGVKAWCKKNGHDPPEKPVVADHALALAREGRTLVHHTRKKQVAALYEQLRRRLGVVG